MGAKSSRRTRRQGTPAAGPSAQADGAPTPPARPAPPTPKALRGSTDPARTVRPVDWTATGRRPAEDPSARSGPRPTPTSEESPSDRLPGRGRRLEPVRVPSAPPAAAVHSLAPEDPRPRPRPLRVDGDDIRAVGVEDLRTSRIVEIVAEPEDAWTADAGASDHFLRGGLVVQVRRADNAVIGVFSSRYALSVRPEDYEPALDIAEDAAGPSARGGRGTRHPTSRRELLRRMESAGFVVTPGSTHGRVTHPDHPGLVVPFASTPSDRRFTRHAVAQIRRVFGIDLRR
ncbi:type II toxin-antitoxin system HicA family toxin [Brachybacterium alimentarium]|uniref:type II toxin-antitoxin system HicA family toxin n=1 Tax=Brachybacterium alimentarium TaxID=47845 RepID=UPI003FD38088